MSCRECGSSLKPLENGVPRAHEIFRKLAQQDLEEIKADNPSLVADMTLEDFIESVSKGTVQLVYGTEAIMEATPSKTITGEIVERYSLAFENEEMKAQTARNILLLYFIDDTIYLQKNLKAAPVFIKTIDSGLNSLPWQKISEKLMLTESLPMPEPQL